MVKITVKGSTLIEAIISMALILFMSMILTFVVNTNNISNASKKIDAMMLADRIMHDIKLNVYTNNAESIISNMLVIVTYEESDNYDNLRKVKIRIYDTSKGTELVSVTELYAKKDEE